MSISSFSHDIILQYATFSRDDLAEIARRRGKHNQLGFAYQLAFVRIAFHYPEQRPFEVVSELLVYVSTQLMIDVDEITSYLQRRQTITEHRRAIASYLNVQRFGDIPLDAFEDYLFQEACRLEQTGPLLNQARQYLRNARILLPSDDTLRRIIVTQRQAARTHIYTRISNALTEELKTQMDKLLIPNERTHSDLFLLKRAPSRPSPKGMLQLGKKLKLIESSGVLSLDLSWLNNNYQRSLTRFARRCSADRLSQLLPDRRYAVLACFLCQTYHSTVDHMLDTHHKLITVVYNRAQGDIDKQSRKQRHKIRAALASFSILAQLVLSEDIKATDLRKLTFDEVARETLAAQAESVELWLTGKYSDSFNLVVQRFSYLRQFSPTLINGLSISSEDDEKSELVDALTLLQEMNDGAKRKLPDNPPLGFLPKRLRPLVIVDGVVNRRAWECALLTAVRDELRSGNLFVQHSHRFGRFDDFFISKNDWKQRREAFFNRSGLPVKAEDVPAYLTARLDNAYDHFLAGLPENNYTSVDADAGWQLSVDTTEKLDKPGKERLSALEKWLDAHRRTIKLPELIIEVDNDLQFSRHFMLPEQQRLPNDICPIIATVMAHGCNIGTFTMAQLTQNISYAQIKQITDWQMTEEAQRQALAQVVNAISQLDVMQVWGDGTTSSSDGQRFRFNRQVLQQTWSNRFNDYAIEFYSFIADNYAPFYSTVIECTDRDAAHVLDGLLYNESTLTLEEHYTDTHGYTEINFAAFAMLGRRFSPRIKGVQQQRIYRVDADRNYGALEPLLARKDRTLSFDHICAQWDRMGHFYASLEQGHSTASTALKRLVGYTGKNNFYRANRDLGRIFKTEHILRYLSDPLARQKIRRGLLKSEQMNALARHVAYGKQGTIDARDLSGQKTTASCLTLIIACIIYWQAKEFSRIITQCDPGDSSIDLSLMNRISPIGWDNIVLYGEYVLDPSLIRP